MIFFFSSHVTFPTCVPAWLPRGRLGVVAPVVEGMMYQGWGYVSG